MRYACLFLILAAPAFAADRATATGKITDASGKPLEHASVLVYEGHVKTGYGAYCPTCWADCGKHATTDAEGNFTIPGLDPDLRFKFLAVKDGFSAAFIDDVDPAKGPAQTTSLKPRPPIEDTSQLVRGLVVNGHGTPLRDAVVEQQGVGYIGPRGMGHSFGPIDWIDLMAVTNEKGEFEIAYGKPAVEMILSVNARGMAPKLFTLHTGADRKKLTVTDGAMITGRLLKPDGTPMPNAEIGLASHTHNSAEFIPEVRIGTKEDGTFALTNVPAGRIFVLYPKMASVASSGFAGAEVPVETADDGQEISVGDIRLRPSFTLRGKIVLSDGKTIPPGGRVTLSADWGMDSQMVSIDADGNFEFKGLPSAVYTVSVAIKGYKPPSNYGVEVLVNRDRSNFVIRMQPAPAQPR
jgi:protocatechuate 3,4-dioxygenase beta subunit